jgi:hypothetical protein
MAAGILRGGRHTEVFSAEPGVGTVISRLHVASHDAVGRPNNQPVSQNRVTDIESESLGAERRKGWGCGVTPELTGLVKESAADSDAYVATYCGITQKSENAEPSRARRFALTKRHSNSVAP